MQPTIALDNTKVGQNPKKVYLIYGVCPPPVFYKVLIRSGMESYSFLTSSRGIFSHFLLKSALALSSTTTEGNGF